MCKQTGEFMQASPAGSAGARERALPFKKTNLGVDGKENWRRFPLNLPKEAGQQHPIYIFLHAQGNI